MKFGFIGTGVMAGAMLESALAAGFLKKEDVLVYDKRTAAAERFGTEIAVSASSAAQQCDVIQLGVKPQDMPALLEEIDAAMQRKKPLVISIAAGMPLKQLKVYTRRAVRLMQNINATIGQSMTAICAAEGVAQEELAFVEGYCECFGKAVQLEEKHFSAFTALAGSAPAFVYLFIDELARAGVSAGLPKSLALEIAAQTVYGSAMQVQNCSVYTGTAQERLHPYELADRVCSPGGTTIAGVNALREHGFTHAVSQAVLASYRRDQELGNR